LKAYDLGIVNGVSANHFAPEDLITREQLASMMMRALTKSGKALPKGSILNFSDKRTFSAYAVEPIEYMSSIHVIKGLSEDTFGPKQNATIEQAVIMAKRLLEQF
jgi:internalin A